MTRPWYTSMMRTFPASPSGTPLGNQVDLSSISSSPDRFTSITAVSDCILQTVSIQINPLHRKHSVATCSTVPCKCLSAELAVECGVLMQSCVLTATTALELVASFSCIWTTKLLSDQFLYIHWAALEHGQTVMTWIGSQDQYVQASSSL